MPGNWMGSKLKFVIQCLIVSFWHHPYLFLDSLSSICDVALNDSITLDVIEHCKNMYADLLSLYIANSYREKIEWSDKLVIHSRLFRSRPSSKKASREKDPSFSSSSTTASSLYLPLYTGCAWSIFRGQRSLNLEARQNLLVAVSFNFLCSAIIHCLLSITRKGIDSIKTCMWFVLIHGYGLVNFSIAGQLFLCLIYREQHIHTDGSCLQYV